MVKDSEQLVAAQSGHAKSRKCISGMVSIVDFLVLINNVELEQWKRSVEYLYNYDCMNQMLIYNKLLND